jgi:uncharacterized protein YabE (DUF348 family)
MDDNAVKVLGDETRRTIVRELVAEQSDWPVRRAGDRELPYVSTMSSSSGCMST